jgi:hypothetical protein
VQRHHDYVLGPNQDARLASVASGATIQLALTLDSDAPFLLRSRAMRVQNTAGVQLGLNQLLMRWSRPERVYTSQDLIRQSLCAPYFGQLGNPIPVCPEVFYPRQATINVDIINDGPLTLTNLTFYFRGVKLFAPGAVKSYFYPPTFGGLPFVYPQTQLINNVSVPKIYQIPITTGPIRYTFRCHTDADFVIRGGQAGDPFDTPPAREIFFTMRDEDEKPYSNDAVAMDVLFGNSDMGVRYPAGLGTVAPVGTGPNSTGLFYPELYIPKNHVLYYDVSRDDSADVSAIVVNVPLAFIGQKVFVK